MNNKVINILNLIFSNKETNDLIVIELSKLIEKVVNSNKNLFDSVSSFKEKALNDEDIRKSFEIDIEKLSPGNPINTWDDDSKSYKNIQLNLLYDVYKESAHRHANKTVASGAPDYNDLLNRFKNQLDKSKRPYIQEFGDNGFTLNVDKIFKDFLNFK